LNAVFIGDGMPQSERLAKLNAVAILPALQVRDCQEAQGLQEKDR